MAGLLERAENTGAVKSTSMVLEVESPAFPAASDPLIRISAVPSVSVPVRVRRKVYREALRDTKVAGCVPRVTTGFDGNVSEVVNSTVTRVPTLAGLGDTVIAVNSGGVKSVLIPAELSVVWLFTTSETVIETTATPPVSVPVRVREKA